MIVITAALRRPFPAGIALIVFAVLTAGASALGSARSMGGLLIVAGGLATVLGAQRGGRDDDMFTLAGGVLYVVTGLVIVMSPHASPIAQALTIILFLILLGLVRLVQADAMESGRTLGHAVTCLVLAFVTCVWALQYLVVALVGELITWQRWPAPGLRVIGLFMVVDMLLWGWSLAVPHRNTTP